MGFAREAVLELALVNIFSRGPGKVLGLAWQGAWNAPHF